MNDWKKLELAFDILEDSEIMEEFEDCLWIKVDKEMYFELNGGAENDD